MQEPTIQEVREKIEKLKEYREGLLRGGVEGNTSYNTGIVAACDTILEYMDPKPRPAEDVIADICRESSKTQTVRGALWSDVAGEIVEALRAEGYEL